MLQNIYLNLILLAAFMFLDYFLTVRAYKLYAKKYFDFIEVEQFELNPRMQKNIKEQKYSYLHLVMVVIILILIYLVYFLVSSDSFLEELYISFIQGMFIFPYIFVVANHFRNIGIYKYVLKNPDSLNGKIKQSYFFSLFSAKKMVMSVIIMLIFLFVFKPSVVIFCATIGMLMLNRIIRKWEKIARKNNAKSAV